MPTTRASHPSLPPSITTTLPPPSSLTTTVSTSLNPTVPTTDNVRQCESLNDDGRKTKMEKDTGRDHHHQIVAEPAGLSVIDSSPPDSSADPPDILATHPDTTFETYTNIDAAQRTTEEDPYLQRIREKKKLISAAGSLPAFQNKDDRHTCPPAAASGAFPPSGLESAGVTSPPTIIDRQNVRLCKLREIMARGKHRNETAVPAAPLALPRTTANPPGEDLPNSQQTEQQVVRSVAHVSSIPSGAAADTSSTTVVNSDDERILLQAELVDDELLLQQAIARVSDEIMSHAVTAQEVTVVVEQQHDAKCHQGMIVLCIMAVVIVAGAITAAMISLQPPKNTDSHSPGTTPTLPPQPTEPFTTLSPSLTVRNETSFPPTLVPTIPHLSTQTPASPQNHCFVPSVTPINPAIHLEDGVATALEEQFGVSRQAKSYVLRNVTAGLVVTCTTSGPSKSMDTNLYVRLGALPDFENGLCSCASTGSRADESCAVFTPVTTDVYASIVGNTAYSGVTLACATNSVTVLEDGVPLPRQNMPVSGGSKLYMLPNVAALSVVNCNTYESEVGGPQNPNLLVRVGGIPGDAVFGTCSSSSGSSAVDACAVVTTSVTSDVYAKIIGASTPFYNVVIECRSSLSIVLDDGVPLRGQSGPGDGAQSYVLPNVTAGSNVNCTAVGPTTSLGYNYAEFFVRVGALPDPNLGLFDYRAPTSAGVKSYVFSTSVTSDVYVLMKYFENMTLKCSTT